MEKENSELKCTRCKRCGRKLKSEETIKIGMGTTCFKKYIQQSNHKSLWEDKK